MSLLLESAMLVLLLMTLPGSAPLVVLEAGDVLVVKKEEDEVIVS